MTVIHVKEVSTPPPMDLSLPLAFWKYLVAYLVAMFVFLAIDLVWLGFVARDFYQRSLQGLLADEVNWYAAIPFYFLFVVGIFLFAVGPAAARQSWVYALAAGAGFGFFTYATYDLTNLATLRDWPLRMVVVDIFWGTFLSAATALAGYAVLTQWLSR
jgi:uncharacterized membrane protein